MGGFPNVMQVRLKTHVYAGKINKATGLCWKTDTGKQELSPDDFTPKRSAANPGLHWLGRGSSGDFMKNLKANS